MKIRRQPIISTLLGDKTSFDNWGRIYVPQLSNKEHFRYLFTGLMQLMDIRKNGNPHWGLPVWLTSPFEKAMKELEKSESAADTLFNSQYYKDYTDRADVQALFNNFRKEQKRQTSQNRKMAALSGGTQESVAAMQKSSSDALADTYNNAAAIGAQWKDSVLNSYINRKSAIQDAKYNIYQNKANSYMSSAANMLNNASEGLKTFDNFWSMSALNQSKGSGGKS